MAAKKKSAKRKSAAKKKSAKARKPRAAARKKIVAKTRKRAPARPVAVPPAVAELDQRIAILRNNLRDLTAQATAYSGASQEELASERIAEQEAKLELLRKQREELCGYRS